MEIHRRRPALATAILLVPFLLLGGAVAGSAAETPSSPAVEPVSADALPVEPAVVALSTGLRAGMNAEIAALFAARRDAVTALRAKLVPALDPVAALALQAEIARLKETLEADCLEVQARYVRQAGLIAEADAIEIEVRRMRGLPESTQPETTPSPSAGSKE